MGICIRLSMLVIESFHCSKDSMLPILLLSSAAEADTQWAENMEEEEGGASVVAVAK